MLIIDQSNVRRPMPIPVRLPKTVLTLAFVGAIQHTQEKMLRPVNRKPGTKYQIIAQSMTMTKNFERETCLDSLTPQVRCSVFVKLQLTRVPG